MRADGALIWNQCLAPSTVERLRAHLERELEESRSLAARDPCEEKARFGDVLSRHCRADLKVALPDDDDDGASSPVWAALAALLEGGGGALRQVLAALLGADAELYELACMVSEPGARRQPVHPDTPCAEAAAATMQPDGALPLEEDGGAGPPPVVVTGFIALQDVTRAMGPTLVWRGTHTAAAHVAWEEERAGFLERCPAHVALLSKGDMLLFDSRALHCGGENSAADGRRRGLFYFSFKRAKIETGKSATGTLRAELAGRYSIGSFGGGIGGSARDAPVAEQQQASFTPPPEPHMAVARTAWTSLFDTSHAVATRLSWQESERLQLPRSSETLDLTYGDSTFDAVLSGLLAAAPPEGGVFIDLGSGSGRAVFAAALLFGLSQCIGVEILEPLHAQAADSARRFDELRERLTDDASSPHPLDGHRLARHIELLCADLFDVPLASADVVFCCCVTWDYPILHRLAAKLAQELKNGARVLTVGRPLLAHVDLPSRAEACEQEGHISSSSSSNGGGGRVAFVETWQGVAHLEWGVEPVFLHRVDR